MSWRQEQFAWLAEKRRNKFSQFGEDGLIDAIFSRIGTENKWVMECGAADGVFFSNSRKLITGEDLWSAVLIEADSEEFEKLRQLYAPESRLQSRAGLLFDGGARAGVPFVETYNSRPNVQTRDDVQKLALYNARVDEDYPLDLLLAKAHAPTNLDLAVIDIDSADYWLFNSLLKHRPRVVMVEFDPNADPDFVPPLGGNGQAGVQALAKLGIGKYYWPVIATKTNLIFVQQELCHLLADDVIAPEIDAPFPQVAAVMSTPRVGPLATMDSVYQACAPLGISMLRGEGAFWHHSLTRGIEKALDAGMDFILTVDYDTVFEFAPTDNAVAKLVCLLVDNPEVDVIVAAQMKREGGPLLATTGKEVKLLDPLIPITQGHFGLTLFRRSVFERLPKPWLNDSPNEKGEWNENRIDADIHFWQQCEAHGINVQMSLDVLIGHMEWVVTWPGQHLQPHYQPLNDWRAKGKPLEAFDRRRVIAAVQSNPALMYGAKLEMGG